MIEKEQELLARVLDLFAQRFDKKADRFPGRTCADFYDFIRAQVAALSAEQIANELSDYLPPEETAGLSLLFRAALAKLV